MSIKKKEIYLIIQNVRSLFNVGSMFRTADVFDVTKIYLCGYTGFPPRDQISKTALGAEEWIDWERKRQTNTLIKKLKKQGVKIVVLETGEKNKALPKFKPKFPLALIVGNELTGVNQSTIELADDIITIPMLGKKDSLNVATAAGIALYQLRN
ncbi:MAG: RNA methyltransferase [Parcubacteria group bacterium]|jgi:tRNA G18 (ribose-2'-O)-methylase SpoU|nr:RNA methyltransferase [Parcubacteria group bacterium]|tara:strand:- start:2504 stop:2965 length:462 start_codon:yes stop_codon:yes gene_type:complete